MKKRLLQSALLLCALACAATAFAQQFPSRPIRLVVPFPPGGNIDFIARVLQPRLSEFLGVSIVIDNRGGAAGIVGAEFTARQPPDGYTVVLGNTGNFGLFPVLYPKLPYDAVKDFAAVGQISASTQLMAAHPAVPARSLKEVIALAKSRPGKLTCAIAGAGTLQHFSLEMLKRQAGVDILMVPYKGSGPAAADLVAGHVDLIMDAVSVSMPYITAGRLKPIAIVNNARLATLPDVPTFEEQGFKGFVARGWQGLLVPAGTPAPVIARLSDALNKTLAQPEVRERFAAQGLSPMPGTPEQFGAFIRAEIEKWGKVAKAANIRID
jgi:tripartite-type tricarboxylate transporter receptor subunit TctC